MGRARTLATRDPACVAARSYRVGAFLTRDTPLDRRIEFDLYYIRNWSLAFDVKILLLTVARVFRDASAH